MSKVRKILKTSLKIGLGLAIVGLLAVPFSISYAWRWGNDYYITPSSQGFVNGEFFTSVCWNNDQIKTVKIDLIAPDGSSALSTFKNLSGHCISYDAYVPNDTGIFRLTAFYYSNGHLQGKATATIGGA